MVGVCGGRVVCGLMLCVCLLMISFFCGGVLLVGL